MRKMYENESSLKNENQIKSLLEKKWNVILHKMQFSYRLDWIATHNNGSAMAVIEYKRRYVNRNQYDTIFLSLGKWNAAMDFVLKNNLVFVFVAEWNDEIGYLPVNKNTDSSSFQIGFGGRTLNTRDHGDIEPIIHLPIHLFKTFE